MSNETLPESAARMLRLLEKRVRDVELRLQALRVQSLEDLDDCQILYEHPTLAPNDGDRLAWHPDPSVVPYRGLWKPVPSLNVADTFTISTNSGSPTVDPSENLYDDLGGADFFTEDGLWLITVTVEAPIGALSDVTGVTVVCDVLVGGSSATPDAADARSYGSPNGAWAGADGSSGSYGWQAPGFLYPVTVARGAGVALIGPATSGMLVTGNARAWVLTDPGTSGADFGTQAATETDLACTVTVSGVKVWNAYLGVNAP